MQGRLSGVVSFSILCFLLVPLVHAQATPSNRPGTASISGTVLDSTGASIPDAQVTLALRNGTRLQTMTSDANGQFTFNAIPAGSYHVIVEAVGFSPFTSNEFTITEQQAYTLPNISMSVAAETTTIVVRPTEEIAAEQIKAEEKQRVLGVFPNFYVSYIPNAAPLTSKQKLSLTAHDTFDWTSYVIVSAGAGIEQAVDAHSGYGQGAAGYAKRWGALEADGLTSDLLDHYVFSSIFHQDPRYFYQGTGSTKSRFYHAVSHAFISRSDRTGKPMPNYSYLLGDLSAAALSNTYYPRGDRGAGLVFTNFAIGIASHAAAGLVEEFIVKRFTKHAPDSSQNLQPAAPPATAPPIKPPPSPQSTPPANSPTTPPSP